MARSALNRSALDLARAAYLEPLYRGRSVLVVGLGDGAFLEVLLARGASRVVGIDADAHKVERVAERLGARALLELGAPSSVQGSRFDVVLLTAGESLVEAGALAAARERLQPGGWLVAAAENGDAPRPLDKAGEGVGEGAIGWYTLHDRLAAQFPSVTMLGQSGLAGSVLAPFGGEEVDPVLDVALQPEAPPELYVAVAGPRKFAASYGLVALPTAELVAGPAAESRAPSSEELERLRRTLTERDAELGRLQGARAQAEAANRAAQGRLADAERKLAELARERVDWTARLDESEAERARSKEALGRCQQELALARDAALEHAAQMRRAEEVLAERDAFVAEAEREQRAHDRVVGELADARRQTEEVETRERAARRRIAELEGLLLRNELQRAELAARVAEPVPAPVAAPVAAPVSSAELDALEAELVTVRTQLSETEELAEKLKQRAEDAQREAWNQTRARSEAEAAAVELREDNARKLKDARKIANLELMRATEEALKKGVTLKEDSARAEKERRELTSEVAALRDELERERAVHAEATSARATEDAQSEQAMAEERARLASEMEAARAALADERAEFRKQAHSLRNDLQRELMAAAEREQDLRDEITAAAALADARIAAARDEMQREREALVARLTADSAARLAETRAELEARLAAVGERQGPAPDPST